MIHGRKSGKKGGREVRDRLHLTAFEVERLIEATKGSRNESATFACCSRCFGMACAPRASITPSVTGWLQAEDSFGRAFALGQHPRAPNTSSGHSHFPRRRCNRGEDT